jgi:hypothetical protein
LSTGVARRFRRSAAWRFRASAGFSAFGARAVASGLPIGCGSLWPATPASPGCLLAETRTRSGVGGGSFQFNVFEQPLLRRAELVRRVDGGMHLCLTDTALHRVTVTLYRLVERRQFVRDPRCLAK